jgi:hypothetical protein
MFRFYSPFYIMYLPTSAIFLTLLTTAISVPTTIIPSDAVNLSDRNALFARALERLEITYLTDSSSLHKRTWPLWGHGSASKGCDCGSGSGSDTGTGSRSGSGSVGSGAGAGAGGSGEVESLLQYFPVLM